MAVRSPYSEPYGRTLHGAASRNLVSRGNPARRNRWLNQPTLTMDTIGAVGRVAAIFTLITPSHYC